jgi:hypothetical protein
MKFWDYAQADKIFPRKITGGKRPQNRGFGDSRQLPASAKASSNSRKIKQRSYSARCKIKPQSCQITVK